MLEPSSSTAFPGSPDRDASTAAAQHRVPLAPDLVHLHRRHPRSLQLEKGLPRLHRPELARVAHQHQPGHAKPVRDPHQRAHPVG